MACCAHALTRSCSWRNLMYLIVSNSTDDVSVWQKSNVQSEFTANKNERRESSLHLKGNFCSNKNLVPSRKVTRSAAVLWSSLPASLWVPEPAFETNLSNFLAKKPRAFYLIFAGLFTWFSRDYYTLGGDALREASCFDFFAFPPTLSSDLLLVATLAAPLPLLLLPIPCKNQELNSTDFTYSHP